MLNLFFNPYPRKPTNFELSKRILVSVASVCKEISDQLPIRTNDPTGNDSIKCYSIAEDKEGVQYTPSDFVQKYSGRERELIIWFIRMFDKGSRITNSDLSICEDWVLSGFGVAAPILEYAYRQNGAAVSISDDEDWRRDFFSFNDNQGELLNVYGQDDRTPLKVWVDNWLRCNYSFRSLLIQKYSIVFSRGSENSCFPTRHEQEGVISSLDRAKDNGYEIDGDLIKVFQTKHGNVRELRSYGDGVRLFFVLNGDRPVIGGFYRKSSAVDQGKAGEMAAKRLKGQGLL